MALGPLVCAVGIALISQVGVGSSYWLNILPGVVIFGLGLALLVAPLTATVLASAPDRERRDRQRHQQRRRQGRLAAGGRGAARGRRARWRRLPDPAVFDSAFHSATLICAALLILGGIVSWFTIPASLEEAATDSSVV